MLKDLSREIKIRIGIIFFSRVIGLIVFPFMAVHYSIVFGVAVASVLLVTNVIVQLSASLYGGYLTDFVGRRKIILSGEFVKTISFIGLAICNSPFFVSHQLTFIFILLIIACQGFMTPAVEASLLDICEEEQRSIMYSVNYWVMNFAIMSGVLIGGWFFLTNLFELMIGLSIVSTLTLLLTYIFIKESYSPVHKTYKPFNMLNVFKQYGPVVRDHPFLLFTLGGVSIVTIDFQRNNYIATRLTEEMPNMNVELLGTLSLTLDGLRINSLLTVLNTILIILLGSLILKAVKNKSKYALLYVGFMLFAIGFSFLSATNNILLLVVGVLILTIGELIYVPSRQTILANVINEEKRGLYLAFNGLINHSSRLIASTMLPLGMFVGGKVMALMILILGGMAILFSYIAIKKYKDMNMSTVDHAKGISS
ncbi:MFS transporter [Bacillus thermotolerans]|mgnify:CR=1 FL=1|uniref:Integral membrane protein n=1 Tax=Bacillus thermotolerans TaxID=1221996 RepID=A0A0F5HP82_BACTR|nr:MFS transporter [Bacillus thermotolerans]KKB35048.1 integral membrane protein [Bacillus thermotolerans]